MVTTIPCVHADIIIIDVTIIVTSTTLHYVPK